jgi:hypothetical protein
VEISRTIRAIGKEDFVTVIMHLGIANRTASVIEQNSNLSVADVQPAQATLGCIGLFVFILGVVAEVLVPVAAYARLPAGENNLFNTDLGRSRPLANRQDCD